MTHNDLKSVNSFLALMINVIKPEINLFQKISHPPPSSLGTSSLGMCWRIMSRQRTTAFSEKLLLSGFANPCP